MAWAGADDPWKDRTAEAAEVDGSGPQRRRESGSPCAPSWSRSTGGSLPWHGRVLDPWKDRTAEAAEVDGSGPQRRRESGSPCAPSWSRSTGGLSSVAWAGADDPWKDRTAEAAEVDGSGPQRRRESGSPCAPSWSRSTGGSLPWHGRVLDPWKDRTAEAAEVDGSGPQRRRESGSPCAPSWSRSTGGLSSVTWAGLMTLGRIEPQRAQRWTAQGRRDEGRGVWDWGGPEILCGLCGSILRRPSTTACL